MRSYVLDELTRTEIDKVRSYIDENFRPSELDGLYWIDLDPDQLTAEQADHDQCQPHRAAVEIGDDFVRLELLIRPASGLRCHCIGYADEAQRRHLLDLMDRMVDHLNLQT